MASTQSAGNSVSIRKLRAFLAVANNRNFTKAADELNVSASALTLTIQELERNIGRKLFERSTRAVELTEAGAHFLPLARRLLQEFAKAMSDITRFPTAESERIRISSAAPVIRNLLTPALREMLADDPGLDIDIHDENTPDIIRSLTAGRIDLGIATLWTRVDMVDARPFMEDRLGVLLAPDHPLADSIAPLPWRAISHERIVSFMDGTALQARIARDPGFGHVLDQARHHASSVAGLKALIEAGAGCAITPALTARPLEKGGLVFRPLEDPVGWRSLYLLTARDRTPGVAVGRLIDTLLRLREGFRHDPQFRLPEEAARLSAAR